MLTMFNAILVERDASPYRASLAALDEASLPAGDVSVSIAMAIGTAGYTAMLCVMTLERHGIVPESARF